MTANRKHLMWARHCSKNSFHVSNQTHIPRYHYAGSIHILQVRKLRHREVKSPAHSNTVKPRAGCQVSSGSKSIGRVLTKAGAQ